MVMSWPRALLSILVAASSACASADMGGPDGGDPTTDAAAAAPDGPIADAAAAPSIDAAAGSPDAAPLPDAAPPPPDAPLPPDAAPPPDAPCTTGWVQLVGNADFESGNTTWTETAVASATPIIRQYGVTGGMPFPAQGGSWAALILGYNNADTTLSQTVTVPASAMSLRFTGYKCWVTGETLTTTPYDNMTITLQNAGGATLETLASVSNLDAGSVCSWTSYNLPAASAHAGETIKLVVHGVADTSSVTSFAFDTVALEALACQ